jgi:hypothetical protein
MERKLHILQSDNQNAGPNCDIKIENRLFENVAQFKYLGMTVMTVTNQNLIQEEIKSILNSINAYYFQSRTVCLLAVSKKM